MSLAIIAEVWDALRLHIDLNERVEAADTLVTYLMENNFEASEIKSAFRGEKEIATALKYYVDSHDHEDEEEDDDYEDDGY
mgnify:CR=1 FL=1